MRHDWMDRARCRRAGVGFFYPDTTKEAEAAKEFCLGCPVMGACADYALTNGIEHGVWGATSPRDRRKILKRRRLAQLRKAG